MPHQPQSAIFGMPADLLVGETLDAYRARRAALRRVVIDYTNYRGERALRTVEPIEIVAGCTEWHPEDQWLLVARDVAKDEIRHFAMKDVHSWTPAP